MSSSNIKSDLNDCSNVSKQQLIDDKNTMQTTVSFTKINIKSEETCKNNEFMTPEENTFHQCIEIKQEDIKVEPEFDTFLDEKNSIIEDSPSRMVEFIEMEDIKVEKEDEYSKEEDPIKIIEGSLICNYCKKLFTSAEYCQKHARRCRDRVYNQPSTSETALPNKKPKLIKNEEKLYECDKCHNKFKSRSGLNDHLRRHKGVGLHACSVCNKKFTRPSHLAAHILIHTGDKPHQCTQCGTLFKQANHLRTHILTHTGARPHACTQCGQAFVHSGDLTIHMRSHTGERPYQCTECNKAFITSSHLTVHMRTHTGEKPYQCTVCGLTFALSSHIKRHMKTHSSKTGNKT